MLALISHHRSRPPMAAYTVVLPIGTWGSGRIPMRILRGGSGPGGKPNFITLIKLDDEFPVAVIEGRVQPAGPQLEFVRLAELHGDDRRILDEFLVVQRELGISTESDDEIVRLVLGRPLRRKNLKWTKDYRVLQGGLKDYYK